MTTLRPSSPEKRPPKISLMQDCINPFLPVGRNADLSRCVGIVRVEGEVTIYLAPYAPGTSVLWVVRSDQAF